MTYIPHTDYISLCSLCTVDKHVSKYYLYWDWLYHNLIVTDTATVVVD